MDMPEEAIRQTLQNEEVKITLYESIKRSPFLIAGVLGLSAVCGIGVYKWKRKSMPTSLFLVQLRVISQSTALGFITLGMGYQVYKQYIQGQQNK